MNKKSFTYNTLFLTGANILTRATGFLYRIFISRFIGAEGLGVFALVTPIYSVCCAVVASGIPVAAIKRISEESSEEKRKALTYAALRLVFIVSVFLFSLLFFPSEFISELLGDERTHTSIIILSFAVLITGFENVYKSSFYSEGIVKIPAYTEIAEQLFRTFCVLSLFLIIGNTDIAASSAVLTSGILLGEILSLIILSLSYSRFRKKISSPRIKLSDSGLIRTATPVTAAKTAESFLSSISEILIPYLLVSCSMSRSEATGVLGVISGMIMPLLYIPCVFTNALAINLVPYISEKLSEKNMCAVVKKCEKALFATSFFSFPCMFFMIAFKDWISEYLFSEPKVALLLPLMSVGGLLAIFRHILSSVMNASGKEKTASLYSFVGNVAELALICALIPVLGIYGYALAYVISNFAMLIPGYVTVKRTLNLSYRSFLHSYLPALPAFISFTVLNFMHASLLNFCSATVSVLLSGFFALFLYAFLSFFICFKKKIIFFSKIT